MPVPLPPQNPTSRRAITDWLIVKILLATLITQLLLIYRLPAPPLIVGALRQAATDSARAVLFAKIPVVVVRGGTIDAQITGPIDAKVQNTPLEVDVHR